MVLKIKDLLNNVYYGTLRQIAEDLVEQILDCETSNDPDDSSKVQVLLELFKQTIMVYCAEGGCELKYTKFESFAIKHFPEIDFNKLYNK
jgi:hypothetical protein